MIKINAAIKVLHFCSQYTRDISSEVLCEVKNTIRDNDEIGGVLPSDNLVIKPGFYSLWSMGGGIFS